MFKSSLLASILSGFIILFACNGNEEESAEKNVRMRAGNVPMSELANMMRDMQELSEELKIRIIDKDTITLPKLSFDLQEMKTAEATDMSVKDDLFNVYTDHFDQAFAEIYKNEISKRSAFNSMVESCLGCHQQYCSGPIKVITSLKIEDGIAVKQ